jgi:glycosyltransferase involved in cell wall biosynthesis
VSRVLVVGCWDQGPGYPRTDTLIAALLELGATVEVCRVDPPGQRGSKSDLLRRPWRWPSWWLAARRTRARVRAAVRVAAERGPVDAVLVPYPGHVAVRWVRSCFAGPIVLDLFLSAYGTAVEDRRLFRPGGLAAGLMASLDARACAAADLVLLDTAAHAASVRERTGLPAERFGWVPVSDPDPVAPSVPPDRRGGGPLRVLYFGTGVPLHGLDTWIEAVERAPSVQLELIGGDPQLRARALDRLGPRVELGPVFAPMHEVRVAIERSHVVAGIFGRSDKAQRVIPFKAVHALAHGRAVVTADSLAVRDLLTPGLDCEVAPAGDAAGLALVLERLAAEPQRVVELGLAARRRYEATFSGAALARRLGDLLAARLGFASARPRAARRSEFASST